VLLREPSTRPTIPVPEGSFLYSSAALFSLVFFSFGTPLLNPSFLVEFGFSAPGGFSSTIPFYCFAFFFSPLFLPYLFLPSFIVWFCENVFIGWSSFLNFSSPFFCPPSRFFPLLFTPAFVPLTTRDLDVFGVQIFFSWEFGLLLRVIFRESFPDPRAVMRIFVSSLFSFDAVPFLWPPFWVASCSFRF